MALLWPKHCPHMVLKIGSFSISINLLRDVPCKISHCWVYPVAPSPRNGSNMALSWPKHGPHMVLEIGSSWILINGPRDVSCQISHCWVYNLAQFPKDSQNMAIYGQNMVHTWSGPLWPKHGPHLVLKIGSSWILINVPRNVLCQFSHNWMYPVVLFLRNGQNMALYGQNMVLTRSFKLVLPES